MAADRFVAVVGARVLPEACAPQVAEVVGFFLSRGWGIGSGGARGADAFALAAVVGAGRSACARSVVFLPGARAGSRSGALRAFAARGGRVVAGAGVGRAALLARSRRLARASAGVVAFLWGPSRGSVFTPAFSGSSTRRPMPTAMPWRWASVLSPGEGGDGRVRRDPADRLCVREGVHLGQRAGDRVAVRRLPSEGR